MNARQHAVLDALDLSRRFFHDNNLFARSDEADRDVHGLDAMVIDSTSDALDHNEMGVNLENDS